MRVLASRTYLWVLVLGVVLFASQSQPRLYPEERMVNEKAWAQSLMDREWVEDPIYTARRQEIEAWSSLHLSANRQKVDQTASEALAIPDDPLALFSWEIARRNYGRRDILYGQALYAGGPWAVREWQLAELELESVSPEYARMCLLLIAESNAPPEAWDLALRLRERFPNDRRLLEALVRLGPSSDKPTARADAFAEEMAALPDLHEAELSRLAFFWFRRWLATDDDQFRQKSLSWYERYLREADPRSDFREAAAEYVEKLRKAAPAAPM